MDIINESAPTKRNGKAARPSSERRANDRLGRKARTVTQDIQELGGMAREMTREKVEQLQTGVADYAKEGREKIRQVEHGIEQYIREQPLKSMLIATGVGMLLGRFWMRR